VAPTYAPQYCLQVSGEEKEENKEDHSAEEKEVSLREKEMEEYAGDVRNIQEDS
jgi:hypothetical protein